MLKLDILNFPYNSDNKATMTFEYEERSVNDHFLLLVLRVFPNVLTWIICLQLPKNIFKMVNDPHLSDFPPQNNSNASSQISLLSPNG